MYIICWKAPNEPEIKPEGKLARILQNIEYEIRNFHIDHRPCGDAVVR